MKIEFSQYRGPTTDDAPSVHHDVQGIAGHVGNGDAESLLGAIHVPHPDVLLGAGGKKL
jgi:hypothetical protein